MDGSLVPGGGGCRRISSLGRSALSCLAHSKSGPRTNCLLLLLLLLFFLLYWIAESFFVAVVLQCSLSVLSVMNGDGNVWDVHRR